MAVPLWFAQEERRPVRRQRKLLDQLCDYEIRKNYGVPYWGAQALCSFFDPLEGQRSSSVPLETKTLIFMSYLRSGSFQYHIGVSSGVSQTAVSRIIDRFANYTISHASKFIDFPIEIEDRVNNKLGFYNLSDNKLNGILGVVDGSHVGIIAPSVDEQAYVNRKRQHSINCQLVANYNYYITDVVAKYPGSNHDSFIWNHSTVRQRLKNGEFGEGYFLGDSGYPLEPWLLTPFPESAADEDFKRRYNRIHKKTRSVVERAIGNWKSRFRSMCKTGGISCYSEGKVCRLVVSSVVLHNFCVKKEIPLSAEDEYFRDQVLPIYENHPLDELSPAGLSILARNTRLQIAQQL